MRTLNKENISQVFPVEYKNSIYQLVDKWYYYFSDTPKSGNSIIIEDKENIAVHFINSFNTILMTLCTTENSILYIKIASGKYLLENKVKPMMIVLLYGCLESIGFKIPEEIDDCPITYLKPELCIKPESEKFDKIDELIDFLDTVTLHQRAPEIIRKDIENHPKEPGVGYVGNIDTDPVNASWLSVMRNIKKYPKLYESLETAYNNLLLFMREEER